MSLQYMDELVKSNWELHCAWSHTLCFDMTLQDWLLGFVSKTVNIGGILHFQCTKA